MSAALHTPTTNARLGKCDRRCPAPALVAVLLPDGLPLQFCGHDFRALEVDLRVAGALVAVDNRERTPLPPARSMSRSW